MTRPEPGSRLDDYLSLLRGFLKIGARKRGLIEAELRDHLTERVADLRAHGMSTEMAIRAALSEFGDAAELAAGFTLIANQVWRRNLMRMTMLSTFVIAALVVAFLQFGGNNEPGSITGPETAVAQGDGASGYQSSSIPERTIRAEDERNARTRTVLVSTTDVDWLNRPVHEFVAYLAEAGNFQFYFMKQDLEEAGLSPDNPITLNLKGIPIEMALRLGLGQVGLGYYLDNGVVIVTYQEKVADRLEVRVYDVQSLLAADASNIMRRGGYGDYEDYGGGSGYGAGGYGEGDYESYGAGYGAYGPPPSYGTNPRTRAAELSTLVMTVAPTSWEQSGGPGGVQIFRGVMIVRQSAEVHREIERLLGEMEAVLNPAHGRGTPRRSEYGSGYDAPYGEEDRYSEGDAPRNTEGGYDSDEAAGGYGGEGYEEDAYGAGASDPAPTGRPSNHDPFGA